MNDETRPPIPPTELDLALDRSLGSLERMRPGQGFAERILARVRIPLPRWARTARDRMRALLSGPRGWVILGSFSVATAATWAVVIGVTVDQWDTVVLGTRFALEPVGLESWQDVGAAALTYWSTARNGMAHAVGALPVPFAALVGGYTILTLVCLVALRRLTTVPARMRVSR